ncbi:MAG: hypothetical protein ABIR94_21780 [Rubrivivax sp.]
MNQTIACPPSLGHDPGGAREVSAGFSILFPSLFREGQALAFPCNADGQVVLDNLSERARHNYLFARAMVGKDYGCPRVQPGPG